MNESINMITPIIMKRKSTQSQSQSIHNISYSNIYQNHFTIHHTRPISNYRNFTIFKNDFINTFIFIKFIIFLTTTIIILSPTWKYTANAIYLDIHVPLHPPNDDYTSSNCLYNLALKSNLALINHDAEPNSEQIDLFTKHIPHITLYLTDFDLEQKEEEEEEKEFSIHSKQDTSKYNHTIIDPIKKQHFLQLVQTTISNHIPCFTSYNLPIITPTYTMWDIYQPNTCLQSLSDSLVTNLHSFRNVNQTIPTWIYDLPDKQEQEYKIHLVKMYGSPNVYKEFHPHVTVGFDNDDDDDDREKKRKERYDIFYGRGNGFVQKDTNHPGAYIPRTDCFGTLNYVGVGIVGEFGGVVLREPEPWIYIPLLPNIPSSIS